MLTKQQISQAIQDLKNKQIIILPTDTIYGLSGMVNQENKLQINRLKQADENKQIIVLFACFKQLKGLVTITKEIKQFFKANKNTTVVLKGEDETFAVRPQVRKDLKKIICRSGLIYSTSVNKHGQQPLFTQADLKSFDSKVNLYFDQEYSANPSRIFDWEKKVWLR
ncbi:Sua5/YciO/YrdC/YwlC family protein [Williamsoniiplasma lucivorax]|uniref:L-threonylcarbamoyladenylate synthase n=1 Tax=Williamsoniiplasma lucivorax TaxID=209274 RepID=A0A2S5RFG5_9MOLU|nr:Sua5/YciO/YrdC/YwlC family protein [Williamsoniiplasma lucivorax]PPE06037.1 tRNA threonylcarbamoyladenosine biosynthesis protein [Williamsoniiplasma lucivorax]